MIPFEQVNPTFLESTHLFDANIRSLEFLARLCTTPGVNASLKDLAENILQDELIRVYNLEVEEIEEDVEKIKNDFKRPHVNTSENY